MATRARSPNYPALGLPKVIEFARRVYDKNHLHKAAPAVVAVAMGYTSLNGNSATAISALKKFGLLEDVDKDLKITQDALAILVEPNGSPERARLIMKAALRPNLFEMINAEYPGRPPSDDILRSFLLRSGFVQSTVDVPIRAYRETMELVEKERAFYNDAWAKNAPVNESTASDESEPAPETGGQMEDVIERRCSPGAAAARAPYPEVAVGPSEREWLRGSLSKAKGIEYRLIVSGEVGSKEIGKLIKLLEAQKLVLEDDDEDLSDLA